MATNIKRQGATALNHADVCPSCHAETKVFSRSFPPRALAFLVSNNEIEKEHIDENNNFSVCDDCFNDMREFVMESNSEIEAIQVTQELVHNIAAAQI